MTPVAVPLAAAARRVPLAGMAWVATVGGVAVAIRSLAGGESAALLPWLRLTVLLLAAASAGCISDPPETLTQTTPFGRMRRRSLAAVLTLTTAATALIAVCTLSVAIDNDATVPLSGLLIELAALSGIGWVACAVLIHVDGHARAPARSAAMLVVMVAVTFVSPRLMHALWVGPGPEWQASHVRWALIGAAALLICAHLSRDPLAGAKRAVQ